MSRTVARNLTPLQLRLLQLLRERPRSSCDLISRFPNRALSVALALQGLREAAFVRRDSKGVYSITRKAA